MKNYCKEVLRVSEGDSVQVMLLQSFLSINSQSGSIPTDIFI
jgi:hypothetical protein